MADCANGRHEPLIEGPPRDTASGAVNIDWTCPACGTVAETDSWRRDAWLKRFDTAQRPTRQIRLDI